MPKLHTYTNEDGSYVLQSFVCPGCLTEHPVTIKAKDSRPVWGWNGSTDAPTFTPSLLVEPDRPQDRCHSFIREGRIEFLSDCHHKLAGRTVDLPEWEDGISVVDMIYRLRFPQVTDE